MFCDLCARTVSCEDRVDATAQVSKVHHMCGLGKKYEGVYMVSCWMRTMVVYLGLWLLDVGARVSACASCM